jgi:hypothetical protein
VVEDGYFVGAMAPVIGGYTSLHGHAKFAARADRALAACPGSYIGGVPRWR